MLRATIVLGIALLAACGGSEKKASSAPTKKLDVADAQRAYETALIKFLKDDCLGAEPMFREIRREHPFSRFAPLSELRIGDCQMIQKHQAEAIETFKTFVRFRPTHSQVPYARFMIAKGHFEQIPSDWFLVPPSHERELQPARDAIDAVRDFITRHPEDDRVPEAEEMAKKSLELLAKHEIYVAKFYTHLGEKVTAVRRLEHLLRHYRGSGKDAEALLLLARTYRSMKRWDDARASLEAILSEHGETEEATEAREELRSLPKKAPPSEDSPSP
jgi:outer membrane protein assembly factor BamD